MAAAAYEAIWSPSLKDSNRCSKNLNEAPFHAAEASRTRLKESLRSSAASSWAEVKEFEFV